MQKVIVRIQSLDDVKNGVPAIEWNDHKNYPPLRLTITHCAVLEAGTVSGQTTLMFRMLDKDGKEFYAEATSNIFQMLWGALIGAEQRFTDEKQYRTRRHDTRSSIDNL
jgi:hypothetical protein